MRSPKTPKTLCVVIVLAVLMILVAPPASAQPLGGSPTTAVTDSSSFTSIFTSLLDWMTGWPAIGSDDTSSSLDPEVKDSSEVDSGGDGDGTSGDGGSGMDPLG